MCVIPHIAFWIFLRKFDSMYYIGIILFACFGLYFGTMLDFYSFIPIYDLILHFFSGILLVFLGHYIYSWLIRKNEKAIIPLQITIIFCIIFSISCASFWEIWEFSGDTLFGLTAQGSKISDTMTDIIAGTIGAGIGGFILYMILRRGNNKIGRDKKNIE